MPNWCTNMIEIRGDMPADLMDELKHGRFSFQRYMPLPPDADDAVRADMWGTKWDLDEQVGRIVSDGLLHRNCAYFETAWSPPSYAIAAMSARYPDLHITLRCFEEGAGFAGEQVFERGITTRFWSTSLDLGETTQEDIDFVRLYFDSHFGEVEEPEEDEEDEPEPEVEDEEADI